MELKEGDNEKAFKHFEKAAVINPEEETALVNLAYLAQQKNDTALTEKYYKQILSIFPDKRDILLAYASLLEKDSRFDEALECYGKTLNLALLDNDESLSGRIRDRIELLKDYKNSKKR